jgi:hypothetical protein
MLIEVSSYDDVYTQFRYSTLSRQLILGIAIYPKLFVYKYIDSLLTWYLALNVISVPRV